MHRNRIVDMSPEALDRRLHELAQLYELGMALQQAKRIGPVNPTIGTVTRIRKTRLRRSTESDTE